MTQSFETIGPEYQELPRFLRETGYKNPTDPLNTVFQTAWKSNLHQFAWFEDQPDRLKFFNEYMALRRSADVSWLSVYPVEEETTDWHDPTRPLYVNMGGGIGHQCAQFKERYPHLPGRVILQDLPHSIAKALPTPGVENMAHDFFEPQPVKGPFLTSISPSLFVFPFPPPPKTPRSRTTPIPTYYQFKTNPSPI